MNRNHKNKHHGASAESGGFSDLIKHSAMGTAVSVALSMIFCILGAALCSLSKDPRVLTFPIALISLYIAAFWGGRIATRLHKRAVLWCGLISGALLAVFFWFLTLFFPHGEANTAFPVSLLLRMLTVGFSILGALIPHTSPKRRHHNRKR